MTTKLSVVFVNYNSTHLAARAIASLRRGSGQIPIEILLVDNNSRNRDAVRQVCIGAAVKGVLLSRNLGYGAAANRAARYASGEYLAVANPDLEFPADAIHQMISFLDRNPQVGVLGPQLEYPDGTLQPSARRYPRMRYVMAGRRSLLVRLFPGHRLAREFQYLGSESVSGPLEVESVVGPFMVFRRTAFDAVGGFDEDFFMFSEDVDVCRRIAERWQVVVLPSARVVHHVGQTRRDFRSFTEFHRVRSLRRFLVRDVGCFSRAALGVLLAGYLATLLCLGLVGIGEHEYSWSARASR